MDMIILLTLTVLLTIVPGTPVLRLDVCSESEAVFTCTVTETKQLQWDVKFVSGFIIERVIYFESHSAGAKEHAVPTNGGTGTDIGTGVVYEFTFISRSPLISTMTTNTSSDLSGATVSCSNGLNSSTIQILPESPKPKNTTFTSGAPRTSMSLEGCLHWSIADDDHEHTVDLNTSYTVTIITESNWSNFTTMNPFIWLTLFYDQDYNISVVATNCVGTSELDEIYMTWNGQCPIPRANISFEYSVGPRLVYQCLPGLQPRGEMVSVCTSNGTWYPNPADIVCTHEDQSTTNHDYTDHDIVNTDGNEDEDHNIKVMSRTIAVTVMFLFLSVLILATVMFITLWLHRRKQGSRSETQTVEQAQNEYTEVEHVHQHQEEDLDNAHDLTDGHSTYTVISELQSPYNHDPDASLNLDSLLIQLRVQVTPKWHQFGLAIGVPEDLLQQYSSYPADERLIEVLNYWLKGHQNPTWRDVAEILHSIELHELAEGIMNVYETGYLPIEIDADDSDSDDNILLPLPIPSNMLPTTN